MILTCKCLNICIVINEPGIQPADFAKLGISNEVLQDSFFKDGAGTVELVEITKEQPSLVHIRSAGDWLVHRCLICDNLTHAIHRDRRPADVLVTHKLMSDPDQISALKSSEAYSQVFKVITNRHDDVLSTPTSVKGTGAVQFGALALQQTLAESLRARTAQVEERVRIFSEQQFNELENFRTTAHEDHQALLRILQRHAEMLGKEEVHPPVAKSVEVTKPGGRTLPTGLPPLPHALPTKNAAGQTVKKQRPFSATAASPQQRQQQLRTQARGQPGLHGPQGSLDSEGLFDLEGMEEGAPTEERLNSGEDTEEDTDESGSHDEGIHIPRSRGGGGNHAANLAKSLPVNVPAFHLATAPIDDFSGDPFGTERNQLSTEFSRDSDNKDIAASIKALAQSVRGGDNIFGDLPRPPRFRTQL